MPDSTLRRACVVVLFSWLLTVSLPATAVGRPETLIRVHSGQPGAAAEQRDREALLREEEAPQAPAVLSKRGEASLSRVLSRSEFGLKPSPWYRRPLDMVGGWVSAAVDYFAASETVELVLDIAAVCVTLAAVGFGVRILWRGRASEAVVAHGHDLEVTETAAKLRDLSRRAARANDYRQGIRYLYLGFLAELRNKRLVEGQTNLTNWEYVRKLRSSDNNSLAERAQALTETFEAKWYGLQTCDRDDYERFSKHCHI